VTSCAEEKVVLGTYSASTAVFATAVLFCALLSTALCVFQQTTGSATCSIVTAIDVRMHVSALVLYSKASSH
jgi:hypothetical protein